MKPVTKAQAKHYLRRVDMDQLLDAAVIIRPRGQAQVLINSLESLYLLFEPNKKSLPGVEFEELELWLRDAIGDTELAYALVYNKDKSSYINHCIKVYQTLNTRMRHYADVLGVEFSQKELLATTKPTTTLYQQL
ncbi:hypothetical protein L2755_13620 [Shewanella abyssi]|uniref:hypothetical protein n=1 Tax=Shewanella abyssi TaxID=311789 RepID=UPI00200CE283|nr:hypothetical protein [Shewanella abyssi]MCL1050653.1 hypothetical protein [Shewanella abyssi]